MPCIEKMYESRGAVRYQVRRFKTAHEMYSFLNRGDNAQHWRETRQDVPSGHYIKQLDRAGERYVNAKLLTV